MSMFFYAVSDFSEGADSTQKNLVLLCLKLS